MLRIRIVFTGMVAAIAVALAVSGASAQNAAGEPSGKPLALLAGLKPPPEIRTAHHAKTAHIEKTAAKKLAAKVNKKPNTITAAHSSKPSVSTATDAPPASAWPDATPPADIAAVGAVVHKNMKPKDDLDLFNTLKTKGAMRAA